MALTKIGSIGVSTGIQFAGVTTIATLNASDNVLSVGGTVNFVSDVSIGGTVSIAGTLTYEDVTNIDSVGLITARNGIVVGSGITLSKDGDGFFTGVTTATTFVGALTGNVTGNISGGTVAGSTGTFTSHVSLGDSDELRLGAGNDLKLYHNGNNSFIEDAGTGDFYIRGADNVRIQSYSDNEDMAKFVKDGAVELYHNNSKKFETQSAGVEITGKLTFATEGLAGGSIDLGIDADLNLYHDNSDAYFDNNTGDFYIRNAGSNPNQIYISGKGGENGIVVNGDGSVELYYDNNHRLTTQAAGVDVRNETECFFKIARTNDSPSDGDYVGNLIFLGKDSGNNFTEYGKILSQIIDQTDGTEDGRVLFQSMKEGTMTTAATIEHGFFQRNTAPGYFADNAQWTSAQPNMHNASVKWTSGHYVASTGVFTCPVAGKYLCTATVQAHRANNNVGGSSTYFNVLWQKNNGNYHIEMVGTVATDASALGVSDVNGKHGQVTATAIIDCAKDDTIRAHSNHGYRNASQNIVGVILIA